MSSTLPLDNRGTPVPVLGFQAFAGQQVTIGATASKTALPVPQGVRFVTITATVDCFFEFGDSTITANPTNSHFMHEGERVDVPVSLGARYISFIRDQVDGRAFVSPRVWSQE